MQKTKYSAVIIAKNEERTIERCLKALQEVADEIIVILDDRTTDNTQLLCEQLGAKVHVIPWDGFANNKNYGTKLAENDWILCLDADEIIDETVTSHLRQLKAQDDTVYLMNILTYIGETPIKYSGWHPDWNIRLFNRNMMRWNDAFVHERLVMINPDIKLEPQRINGLVHHYSFSGWDHMDSKYDYYAQMRSDEWIRSGKSPNIMKRLLGPEFRFFKTYFLRLGILDGRSGMKLALREYKLKKGELKCYHRKKKQSSR
jgi:glycosyltransferase involved in cell wall biosynthesis